MGEEFATYLSFIIPREHFLPFLALASELHQAAFEQSESSPPAIHKM